MAGMDPLLALQCFKVRARDGRGGWVLHHAAKLAVEEITRLRGGQSAEADLRLQLAEAQAKIDRLEAEVRELRDVHNTAVSRLQLAQRAWKLALSRVPESQRDELMEEIKRRPVPERNVTT